MKILYVSQYFPPEMGAPAARVAELACHWARDGHEVTVLTGFPNHPTGRVHPEYQRRLRHLVVHEDMRGVRVVRTWLLPFANRKLVGRMLNYGSFCASSACTGLFIPRPDVVIGSSPQLLVGLSGWWLAHCKRTRFIFEVRDLWPESLSAVGMGRAGSWFHRSLGKLAACLYRSADQIVVVAPAFKEYLTQRYRLSPEKISVVENGVETELFAPRVEAGLKRELGAEGKFLVSYIGTLGMAHGLGALMEAAAQLQKLAPEVVILLVGEGAEKESLCAQVRSRALSNVRLVGQQPRERVPAYICASDACLVLLRKAEIFRTVIPSKMLEFMSCGRPVILTVDGQARQILERAEAGIYVEPEDSDSLVQAIMRLAKDAPLRAALGRNGRQHILRHYMRRHTAQIYLEAMRAVLGHKNRGAAAA